MKAIVAILGFVFVSASASADQTLLTCHDKFDSLELTKTATNYQLTRSTFDRHLGQGEDGHLQGQIETTYSGELDDVTSVQKTANSLIFQFNDGKSLTVTLNKGGNGTSVQFTSDIDGLAKRLKGVLVSPQNDDDLFYTSCEFN